MEPLCDAAVFDCPHVQGKSHDWRLKSYLGKEGMEHGLHSIICTHGLHSGLGQRLQVLARRLKLIPAAVIEYSAPLAMEDQTSRFD